MGLHVYGIPGYGVLRFSSPLFMLPGCVLSRVMLQCNIEGAIPFVLMI